MTSLICSYVYISFLIFHLLIMKKKNYYFLLLYQLENNCPENGNYENVLIMNVLQLRFLTMLFYVKPKDSEAPVTAKANREPKTIKCTALTH